LHYFQKNDFIKAQALPVLQGIRTNKGDQVKNVYVPFTDGRKALRVVIDLDKALEDKCDTLINNFERISTLATIDEYWKEHLRELDDLKQAANNASLEQKDPLLIYKLESFNLFKNMVNELNGEMLSMLYRGYIENQDPGQVKEAQQQRRVDEGLKTSRTDDTPGSTGPTQPQQVTQKENTQPIRVEKKVGRNDPCPCGSGKKYKKCHGLNA